MIERQFRVWVEEEKKFYYSGTSGNDLALFFSSFGDYPLSQSTGLKDKNGKEIYKGDIVQFFISNPFLISPVETRVIGKVVYQYCEYIILYNLDNYGCNNNLYSSFEEREIIGSIYETPELLDNK